MKMSNRGLVDKSRCLEDEIRKRLGIYLYIVNLMV